MTGRAWIGARLTGATAIAAPTVTRLGTGPLPTGIRSVSTAPLVAACGIAVLTTAGGGPALVVEGGLDG